MDSTIRRQLKIALSIVVFLSYAALATTFEFRGPLTLGWPMILIACMPLGEWLDRRFSMYRKVTTGITIAVSAVLMAAIPTVGLLYALTLLLIYIQSFSMLHLKKEQTYNHVLLMSFFLLLAATVMSPSATIGFVLILFVIAASWLLLLLEAGIASQRARIVRVEDLVDISHTASHRTGLITRLLDRSTVIWIMSFSLLLLLCTALIFAAVPRTEAGLLGTMNEQKNYTTGIGDEMDLSLGGMILGDASPVMQVRFPELEGGKFNSEMYWRVTTLDSYDNNIWSRRGLISRGSMLDLRFRRFYCAIRAPERDGVQRPPFLTGESIRYEAFADKLAGNGVPALQTVVGMSAKQGAKPALLSWDPAGDFTVHMTTQGDKGVEIKGWSEVYTPQEDQLRASSDDYMSVMVPSDYRLLTSQNLSPPVLDLVNRLTKGLETPYDRLEVLQDYLTSSDFTYTTKTPALPPEGPIDAFILNVRKGHCEMYASALTMMARSLGIPARLVKGYRGGIWDSNDQAYTVVNNMAHVWVEAYYPDVGWVIYDPSPPNEDVDLFSLQGVSRSYSKWSMKARMFWLRSVIGYTPNDQYLFFKESTFALFRSFGIGRQDLDARFLSSLAAQWTSAALAVGLAFFVFGTLFTAWRIGRRLNRVAGPRLTADRRRARKFMELFHRKLSRLGLDCFGLTAEDLMGMVNQGSLTSDADVGAMLQRYNDVRFGNTGLTAKEYRAFTTRLRNLSLAGIQT
jgi:protein-glutamine gamma-glutamyltransferase